MSSAPTQESPAIAVCLQCGQELGPALPWSPREEAGTEGAGARRCPECSAVEPDPAWPVLVDESPSGATSHPRPARAWLTTAFFVAAAVAVIVLAGPSVPVFLVAGLLASPLLLALVRRFRAHSPEQARAQRALLGVQCWLLTPAGVQRCTGRQGVATPWPQIETVVHTISGRTRLILRGELTAPETTFTIWLSPARYPAPALEATIVALRAAPRSSIAADLLNGPRRHRPRVVTLCRRCRGACRVSEVTSPCISCGHTIEQPDAIALSGFRRARGDWIDVLSSFAIGMLLFGVLALLSIGAILAGEPYRMGGVLAAIPAFIILKAVVVSARRAAFGPDTCWILRQEEWVVTAMHDTLTHRWADTISFDRGPDRHGRSAIVARVRDGTAPTTIWLSSAADADTAVRIGQDRLPKALPVASPSPVTRSRDAGAV